MTDPQPEAHASDAENLPRCDRVAYIKFNGFVLSHAIWRNSYGSRQPETGVRYLNDASGFHLMQHDCDDWNLVTVVALAGLHKGWTPYRIAELITWLDRRARLRRRSILARINNIIGEHDA